MKHDSNYMADAAKAAAALAEELLRTKSRLAVAESCTGGGVGYVLTAIPGSSRWFERGFITYSNASKREVLGVDGEVLDRHGAVSEPVVAAMAEGAIAQSRADYGIAISGIAGPDGGSVDKPVGTVCFAFSRGPDRTITERCHFTGDRRAVREQSIAHAIKGMVDFLRGDSNTVS
jgi:nicotinamide-nucleotide amidase